MRTLGVHVALRRKQRPEATLVLVEGDWSVATATVLEPLTSAHVDLTVQLLDLHRGLASRLSSLTVDRIAIRRAEWSGRPSNKDGPRIRLLAEGALAVAAASMTETYLLTGRDYAQRSPASSKDDLVAKSAELFGSTSSEAAEAALAAASF